MSVTADQVVKAYVDTRAEIERRKKALEEELKPLQEVQENREKWLMQTIQTSGLRNLPTEFGTAYVTRAESVTCADWDAFIDHVVFAPIKAALMPAGGGDSGLLDSIIAKIKESAPLDLLDHRINKTAALEVMGEERENPPPPGANYSAVLKIGVRKS